MNRKVLFIVNAYYPRPVPTSICVMYVQDALWNMGIESDVLQAGEKDGFEKATNFGRIYSVNSGKITFDKTRRNFFNYYLKKIPLLITWPILSPPNVKKYKKWIRENEKNYHAIIAIMAPGDTALAASGFDDFIIYELDSLINNPEYKRGVKKYYRRRLYKLEKFLYEKASLIIHLNNNKKFYSTRDEYTKYREKFRYTDIPYLVNKYYEHKKNEGKIRAVYLGSFARDYRSPEYLLKLIGSIRKELVIRCDFYTRGACEDLIENGVKDYPGTVFKNDYVPHETVKKIIEESDLLISVGNKLEGNDYSLPSKTIEYIASGKPVLHIVGGDNDSAVSYFKNYGLACIIDPNDSFEKNTRIVVDFIKKSRNESIPFNSVENKFPMNVPKYTAEIIRDYINTKKEKEE